MNQSESFVGVLCPWYDGQGNRDINFSIIPETSIVQVPFVLSISQVSNHQGQPRNSKSLFWTRKIMEFEIMYHFSFRSIIEK